MLLEEDLFDLCRAAANENHASSIVGSVAGRRKYLSRRAQMSHSTAACTTHPTERRVNDDSFKCSVSIRLRLAHTIAHPTHGVNELDWERFVDFSAQVPDVNIHDVGHSLEALIRPHDD